MKLVDLDKKIPTLNNLSLREVFEGGQLFTNGDFNDGTTGWSNVGGSLSIFEVINNIFNGLSTATNARIQRGLNNNIGDSIYRVAKVKSTSNLVGLGDTSARLSSHTGSNDFEILSNLRVETLANRFVSVVDGRSAGQDLFLVDYIYAYNLTALGIASLTKAQLDAYYELYQSGVQATGFVQKTSKNLHGGSNILKNIVITSAATGATATNINFETLYLPVIEGQVLSTQGYQNAAGASLSYVFYDQSNNRITSGSGLTNIVVPAGAFFFGRSVAKEKVPIAQTEYGTVATTYVPYNPPFAIAKGIDEVAYGTKTYREIFEGGDVIINGDFSNGDANWDYSGVIQNGIYTMDTSIANFLYQAYSFSGTKKHYFAINAFGGGQFVTRVLGSSNESQSFATEQSEKTYTAVLSTTNGTSFRINRTANTGIVKVKKIYLIDLTSLFGSGNEPDKATMDRLFQQYQEGGTIQAQAFIQTAGKDTRVIDSKLPYLNMMSIREVFESNQLIINGDFTNGTTGFATSGVSLSIVNNKLRVTASAFNSFLTIYENIKQNKKYYFATRRQQSTTAGNTTRLTSGNAASTSIQTFLTFPNNDLLTFESSLFTPDADYNFLFIHDRMSASSYIDYDFLYLYDLTALNLTHLTQAELDAMFALYEAGTLKLSNVFETGNLVTNGDFSDGTTGWTKRRADGTFTVVDGVGQIVSSPTQTFDGIQQTFNFTNNNSLYIKADVKSNQNASVSFGFFDGTNKIITFTPTNNFNQYSQINQVSYTSGITNVLLFLRVEQLNTTFLFDNIYAINLTTHNLQAMTKTFMDDLFKAYQRYKSPLFIDKNGVAYGTVFISKGGA